MRFFAAHKTTTYMMMLCAFFALVLSGELSPIPVLLAFVGIVWSWRWEPPRIDFAKYDKLWMIISLGVFAYSLIDFLAGSDIILVGAHFLLYLVVAKLFNRKESKDYLHIYLLSFLMLVSGTVLNSEFTYGLFFLGFVLSTTWALILFHLRRDMEQNFLLGQKNTADDRARVERIMNSRRIVGRRFFVGTSFVSLTVFAGASVLFLAIPRIGMGFFFNQSRSSISMTGFSDGVRLGGHGVIKSDNTVVMRVKVDSEYQGRAAPYLHWRGVAFDEYRNGQWGRSRRAPEARREVNLSDKKSRHYPLYDARGSLPRARRSLSGTMRQEIYLEPTGYDVLFGASMPRAFEFSQTIKERARASQNDEIRYAHGAGLKYVVYSDVDPPAAALLRANETPVPPDYQVYLDVPPEVSPQVQALAEEIIGDASNNYDKAKRIESWLKTKFEYTLVMKQPPAGTDPVDFFLLQRKKGHCEYFSSAMAIMLRTVGVPTRNVNGFLGGEWNEYDEYIAVRAADAHSWVEVLFPGNGWVTFDPTPEGASRTSRGEPGFLDRLRRFGDTLRFKWFKWVIEYDLYRQLQLFKKLGAAFRGTGGLFKGKGGAFKAWMKEHRKTLAMVIAAMILGAMVLGFWFRRKEADTVLLGRRRASGPSSKVAKAYRTALKRFAKQGHPRPRSATPLEFSRKLSEQSVPGAGAMSELTELYYAVEYGGEDVETSAVRAKSLVQGIASELSNAKKS